MSFEELDVITAEEFQRDPDSYIERVRQEKQPIRIREQDGREVILISWEQHLERFRGLYSAEEMVDITEAMRRGEVNEESDPT